MHSHILVTGGAGFAGSSLCIALAQSGVPRVTAFDNLRRRGSELNLRRLQEAGVGFVHGDVRCASDLLSIRPEPDLIIECSAEPSAQAGYGVSPDYLVHTNLTGCYHCLDLARRSTADFVFVSTSRVYPYRSLNGLRYREDETRYSLVEDQPIAGASAAGISEDYPLDGPRSLYGMTKLAGELMVIEFADAYGFRAIVDRFGLLTGPYQMAKSDQGVIALWAAAHYFGRDLAYIGFGGAGKQVRDFLHVDDFTDLVKDQIANFDAYAGRIWNAGGGAGNSLSLLETTALCRELTGREIRFESIPENRPADVRIYITDHRRVSAVAGWRPKRDARATLGDIVNWLRRDEAVLRPIMMG